MTEGAAPGAGRQRPLNSGYGWSSTASETLAGVDLSGKTVLVTGAYSGIGLETTRAFARVGASVIVPARRPSVALDALRGIPRVSVQPMDLADLTASETLQNRLLTPSLLSTFSLRMRA